MAFQQLREAVPQDVPVAPPSRKPLLPNPHDLPGVPAQSSTVTSNAIVGKVAPHHGGQTGMLLEDRCRFQCIAATCYDLIAARLPI